MTEEQAPIKIVIPVEEESPLVPEPGRRDVKAQVRQAGQQITRTSGKAAKRAWQSPAAKKATSALGRGFGKMIAGGAKLLHSVVVKTTERQVRKRASATRARIESTDWKYEAKKGTGKGLRWLSRRTGRLADRLAPDTSADTEVSDNL